MMAYSIQGLRSADDGLVHTRFLMTECRFQSQIHPRRWAELSHTLFFAERRIESLEGDVKKEPLLDKR